MEWTEEHIEYLIQNYPHKFIEDIVEEMNNVFNLTLRAEEIKRKAHSQGIRKTDEMRKKLKARYSERTKQGWLNYDKLYNLNKQVSKFHLMPQYITDNANKIAR